jgi:hypothetical protein
MKDLEKSDKITILLNGKGHDARIIIEIGFRGWGLGIRSKP